MPDDTRSLAPSEATTLDTQSLAPSEATTLVNHEKSMPEQRTTLFGQPIEHEHDHLTNIMMSDGSAGFAMGSAGANLLPHGYTDKSLVRIPVKMSDVEEPSKAATPKPAAKKGGFLRKLSSGFANKNGGEEVKIVMMSRGDYLKYWVKGNDGKFAPSVEEPPEGRKEWVRKQLELNEQWKKDDPTLGKASVRSFKRVVI